MRIFPLGDSALTIELGSRIDPEVNSRAIAMAATLQFDGLIEAVPAYASVTLYFDPPVLAHASAQSIALDAIETLNPDAEGSSELVEVPIRITPEDSPDLARVAEFADTDAEKVIETFLSRTYRVYMLGFLPGFAYMGEVDDRIAAPRLETPRTKVPAGSVGIAGKQCGIYPLGSPGGWNIIGRTDLKMFEPDADRPCRLKPGDEVRFVRC